MQRRTARPTGGNYPSSPLGRNTTVQPSSPQHKQKRKSSTNNIVWAIAIVVVLLVLIFSIAFPAEFQQVEQEAVVVGKAALKAEQELAGKVIEQEQQFVREHFAASDNTQAPADWNERIAASKAASERMEQQSSRWVDGEKKLKRKLQVLYDRQQKGMDLGVPVLTRFLGDDFPAYVTADSGIDVEVWKKNVESKYAEMRKEEEAWQAEMQKIIDARERDIGITTA